MTMHSHPKLRLRRGDHDGPMAAPVCPGTLTFPSSALAVRERLVAGVVDVAAVPDNDDLCPVIGRIGGVGRDGPDEFLRGLESTIARMQGQIDDLRRECDEAFKFPTLPSDDEPRPRAA